MARHVETNADAPTASATHHPDVLAHIAKAYKVSAAEAPTWLEYDERRCVWWHRVGLLLMDLLASPASYLKEAIRCATIKRGGIPPTPEWVARWRSDIAALRSEIMAEFPGRGPMWVSNQILGMHGNGRPDWLTIRALIHGHWLPRKPPTPAEIASREHRRDPAGRMQAADALIDSIEHDKQHWADR